MYLAKAVIEYTERSLQFFVLRASQLVMGPDPGTWDVASRKKNRQDCHNADRFTAILFQQCLLKSKA